VPEWEAEVVVDEMLVRALLAEQFPELDASSARLLGEGWDNSVWVVEERWAFRFPRREIAIPGVERELAVLPLLAPLLAVPTPEPRFVGVPSGRFRWPFFGAPLLAGREPADAELSEAERVELGAALGAILRRLHAADTLDAVDPDRALPVDFNRRADMPVRVSRARENGAALEALGIWRQPAAFESILATAEGLPPSASELVLAHGDLHQRHVLVADGSLSAVIDWGDVCRADPCIDLMLMWSLLPSSGREPFRSAYGPVTDEQLLRARVLALVLDSMLGRYAHDAGNASLQREALAGLERTLVD
jgi:aminoglycoside phosphotransferase (APT) family kinase protein